MKPRIRTARQKRCIELLFPDHKVSSWDIQCNVGVLNAPELIASLRRDGWDIECELVKKIDQDGKHTYPGLYSLTDKSRPQAQQILSGGH